VNTFSIILRVKHGLSAELICCFSEETSSSINGCSGLVLNQPGVSVNVRGNYYCISHIIGRIRYDKRDYVVEDELSLVDSLQWPHLRNR
jgi:hypothetical protein